MGASEVAISETAFQTPLGKLVINRHVATMTADRLLRRRVGHGEGIRPCVKARSPDLATSTLVAWKVSESAGSVVI